MHAFISQVPLRRSGAAMIEPEDENDEELAYLGFSQNPKA